MPVSDPQAVHREIDESDRMTEHTINRQIESLSQRVRNEVDIGSDREWE